FDTAPGEGKPTITGGVTFRNVPLTSQILDNPYAVSGQTTSATPSIFRVDQEFLRNRAAAWNATLEREVAGSMVISASYVGSSDAGLTVARTENETGSGRFVGRPNQRLAPIYANFITITGLGHSSFHGLQLKAESRSIKRIGLQFGSNYSW